MLRMRLTTVSYPPCASMADKTWWGPSCYPITPGHPYGDCSTIRQPPYGLIYFFVGGCGRRSGGDV